MHRTYSMRQSRAPTASQIQNPPPPTSSTKSGRFFGKTSLGELLLLVAQLAMMIPAQSSALIACDSLIAFNISRWNTRLLTRKLYWLDNLMLLLPDLAPSRLASALVTRFTPSSPNFLARTPQRSSSFCGAHQKLMSQANVTSFVEAVQGMLSVNPPPVPLARTSRRSSRSW